MIKISPNKTSTPLLPLAILSLCLGVAQAGEPSATKPTGQDSPWGFNLSTYLWLAGVNGEFSAGPFIGLSGYW